MAMNEMTRLYDTLLSIPGMNDQVRLNLQISRKVVLLLSQILESGLKAAKDSPNSVLAFFPENANEELRAMIDELLQKAGLTELSAKLKDYPSR